MNTPGNFREKTRTNTHTHPHLEGGGGSRGNRALGVLARCPQAADGAGVGLELVGPAGAVDLLELRHGPVHHVVVEVLATEVGVAARGLNLVEVRPKGCKKETKHC